MSTPDTEWEKGFDEVVGKDTLFVHKGKVIKFFRNLLTSHDTYWKERVNRVLVAMSWSEENETSEAIRVLHEVRERLLITDEDNLK